MISIHVQDLVTLLAEFAGNSLERPDDFALCLQHGNDLGKADLIGTLAFHGKFLTKLLRTRAAQGLDSEFTEKLDGEVAKAMSDFEGFLEELFADVQDESGARFREGYFELTHDAVLNVIGLAHDFGVLKDWELEMTHGESD
jgi:hypothetical protein